jgi:glutamyl-tRNA(Gln) amidotransferase subunit D
MLQNLPVPVVLTGAQRSSDRGSSDSHMNLIASVVGAKSNIAEVMICMHGTASDDFCYLNQGTKTRKMHTSRRDALRSVNADPYAKVWYRTGDIQYVRSDFKKRDEKRPLVLDTKINPNAGIVYIHPGISPKMIDAAAKIYDGVVLAVMGLGHVPTNQKDKIMKPVVKNVEAVVKSGVPVIVAPQTIYGRLNMNVYEYGRRLEETGVIGNYCDWTPETALVKLMWVLGHTKDMKKISEMMLTNYAGEISDRSEVV